MKANIHPKWHRDAVVTCSCGNTFTTGANNKTVQIDICSACHPFFTGEMRFVDRQGRVDKFMAKMKKAQGTGGKKAKKAKAAAEKEKNKSYRELLRDQQSSMREADKAEAKTADDEKTEAKK